MTDNEIKKALECCQQNTRCVECPMWKKGQNCMNKLYKYALDLINRQQAEIERLQNDLSIWKDIAHRETSYVSLAKAEAYKEFAERLKGQAYTTSQNMLGKCWYELDSELIDNLVKEMVDKQRKEEEKNGI